MSKKLLVICSLLMIVAFWSCSPSSTDTPKDKDKEEEKEKPEEVVKPTYTSIPMTHILICCRFANEGLIKFKVGDEWLVDHTYMDIEQTRAILSTIQDAGINDIIVDLTNPSQWESKPGSWPGCVPNEGALWERETKYQLETVDQVCAELGMKYIFFIGNPAAHTMAYWNGVAKRIWEGWAQKDIYRKYGFGDNRPILVVFYMGENFKEMYENTPAKDKEYLAKFRIGTCQVNSPMNFIETDGWGYRHQSSSSNNAVRFVAPNQGVDPSEWRRSTLSQWKEKIEWAGKAKEYTIFGSYDDTCDAIFWGIADTKESTSPHKRYPNGEAPDAYYNAVKEYLLNRNK